MKPNFFTPWLIFLHFVTQAGDLGLSEIDVTAPKGIYQSEFSSTATKTNTSIMDVPQTVNVINQKQLQDQQATDLGKAITYVPGVDLDQGEGNRDAFIIRGNKTTADIFLDGIKDDADTIRARFFNQFT